MSFKFGNEQFFDESRQRREKKGHFRIETG